MTLTHKDIYTKFMIEYDKANVTSSYPSLTEYEVATVLDKAYNALIAQKVTGNNVRRAGFEADLKAIEDLSALIKTYQPGSFQEEPTVAPNVVSIPLNTDHLYYLNCYLTHGDNVYPVKGTTIAGQNVVGESQDPGTIYMGTISHLIDTNVPLKLYAASNVSYEYDVTLKLNYRVVDTSGEEGTLPTGQITVNIISGPYRTVFATNITPLIKSKIEDIQDTYSASRYTVYFGGLQVDFHVNSEHISQNDDPNGPQVGVGTDQQLVGGGTQTIPYSDVAIDFALNRLKPNPYDNVVPRMVPVQLVNHQIATKFYTTAYNMPWIKIPVGYIEHERLYVVYDLLNAPSFNTASIVYIKRPHTFVKDLTTPAEGYNTYFEWSGDTVPEEYMFECNSTVAEELISLAVMFALENVESQRLNSKLNMRGLEA